MWRDCDFWWADDRALDQVLAAGRGVGLANFERGLPVCIDAAVLVAKETFMSRVENMLGPCEKGEESDDIGWGWDEDEDEDSFGGEDCKGEGDRRRRRW
jgi:hypothetical protein